MCHGTLLALLLLLQKVVVEAVPGDARGTQVWSLQEVLPFKNVEELAVDRGIQDTTAYVGQLFNYLLPNDAFTHPVDEYKVREAGRDEIPVWFYWNETSRSLLGLPSALDQGTIILEVTAVRGGAGNESRRVVSTHFIITVMQPDGEYTRLGFDARSHSNVNVFHCNTKPMTEDSKRAAECDSVFHITLVLGTDLQRLDATERVTLVYKFAHFVSQCAEIAGLPKLETLHHVLSILTVNSHPASPGVELSLTIGCSDAKIAPRLESFARVMERAVSTGGVIKEIGFNLIGWKIGKVKSPQEIRRFRRQALRRTPAPTSPTDVSTEPSPSAKSLVQSTERGFASSLPEKMLPTTASNAPTMSAGTTRDPSVAKKASVVEISPSPSTESRSPEAHVSRSTETSTEPPFSTQASALHLVAEGSASHGVDLSKPPVGTITPTPASYDPSLPTAKNPSEPVSLTTQETLASILTALEASYSDVVVAALTTPAIHTSFGPSPEHLVTPINVPAVSVGFTDIHITSDISAMIFPTQVSPTEPTHTAEYWSSAHLKLSNSFATNMVESSDLAAITLQSESISLDTTPQAAPTASLPVSPSYIPFTLETEATPAFSPLSAQILPTPVNSVVTQTANIGLNNNFYSSSTLQPSESSETLLTTERPSPTAVQSSTESAPAASTFVLPSVSSHLPSKAALNLTVSGPPRTVKIAVDLASLSASFREELYASAGFENVAHEISTVTTTTIQPSSTVEAPTATVVEFPTQSGAVPRDDPVNTPPILLNPVNNITVSAGVYFEYHVPSDTFYDLQEGATDSLTLSLLNMDQRELTGESWVQFDPKRQMIFGLPLPQYMAAMRQEFVLVAFDSRSASDRDVFVIDVDDSSMQDLNHYFAVSLETNLKSFVNNSSNIVDFVLAMGRFFNETSDSSVLVTDVQNGSVVVHWSNATLSRGSCQNETIQEIFQAMSGGDNESVSLDFQAAMAPQFVVKSVELFLTGNCLPLLVLPPGGPGTGSDALLWILIPVVVVAILVLIIAMVLCYIRRKRRYSGKLMLDDERPIFSISRKPVLLADELQMRDVGNVPKRPVVMDPDLDGPEEPESDPGVSQPARPTPPPYFYPDDFEPVLDSLESPPPSYKGSSPSNSNTPPSRQAPEYRLPPPYSAHMNPVFPFRGSSEA